MNQKLCLLICFFVGVLVFYLLKNTCGCKNVVEGQGDNACMGIKFTKDDLDNIVNLAPYTWDDAPWFILDKIKDKFSDPDSAIVNTACENCFKGPTGEWPNQIETYYAKINECIGDKHAPSVIPGNVYGSVGNNTGGEGCCAIKK